MFSTHCFKSAKCVQSWKQHEALLIMFIYPEINKQPNSKRKRKQKESYVCVRVCVCVSFSSFYMFRCWTDEKNTHLLLAIRI